MNVDQSFEKFAPGVKFSYKKNIYEVTNSKKVTGNLVIITSARTFNLLPSEIEDFMESVFFDVSDLEQKKVFKPTLNQPKSNALNMENIFLPQSSAKAKDAMEKMLELFADPDKVDAETIKKANALCMISDKIVSIERLQLDYVKMQKG